MLASRRLIESRTNQLGQMEVRWLTSELRRWHRAAHRTSRETLDCLSFDELLDAARHELLLSPVYYLFAHPPAQSTCTSPPSSSPRARAERPWITCGSSDAASLAHFNVQSF
jgi:hypothetical protein